MNENMVARLFGKFNSFAFVDSAIFHGSRNARDRVNSSTNEWIGSTWTFLNDIEEKSILEKIIELEELLFIEEMIKEYSERHIFV
ncbi:hypothetical protein L1987_14393 [Smallanthus sonchifolius]|uniref:Uncharacterized protein n=1 Tax=Smallanthus sonchifolius TaxID=185202 RepID=A0ACB9J2L5_9ASTR|nr:hypothetical protein L1987_14393 [Smallanthus sonchifolius]